MQVHKDMSVPNFLGTCTELIVPINKYFEKVFVMCDNPAVQQNRLSLLRGIGALSDGILDFSELPGF